MGQMNSHILSTFRHRHNHHPNKNDPLYWNMKDMNMTPVMGDGYCPIYDAALVADWTTLVALCRGEEIATAAAIDHEDGEMDGGHAEGEKINASATDHSNYDITDNKDSTDLSNDTMNNSSNNFQMQVQQIIDKDENDKGSNPISERDLSFDSTHHSNNINDNSNNNEPQNQNQQQRNQNQSPPPTSSSTTTTPLPLFIDAKGNTPLHIACRNHPPLSAIRALLSLHPHAVYLPTHDNGWLPLHLACYCGCDVEVACEILDGMEGQWNLWRGMSNDHDDDGADLNEMRQNMMLFMQQPSLNNDDESGAGGDVTSNGIECDNNTNNKKDPCYYQDPFLPKDHKGRTPLHHACASSRNPQQRPDLIRLLLLRSNNPRMAVMVRDWVVVEDRLGMDCDDGGGDGGGDHNGNDNINDNEVKNNNINNECVIGTNNESGSVTQQQQQQQQLDHIHENHKHQNKNTTSIDSLDEKKSDSTSTPIEEGTRRLIDRSNSSNISNSDNNSNRNNTIIGTRGTKPKQFAVAGRTTGRTPIDLIMDDYREEIDEALLPGFSIADAIAVCRGEKPLVGDMPCSGMNAITKASTATADDAITTNDNSSTHHLGTLYECWSIMSLLLLAAGTPGSLEQITQVLGGKCEEQADEKAKAKTIVNAKANGMKHNSKFSLQEKHGSSARAAIAHGGVIRRDYGDAMSTSDTTANKSNNNDDGGDATMKITTLSHSFAKECHDVVNDFQAIHVACNAIGEEVCPPQFTALAKKLVQGEVDRRRIGTVSELKNRWESGKIRSSR